MPLPPDHTPVPASETSSAVGRFGRGPEGVGEGNGCAPPSPAPLPASVPVRAVEDVLARRVEQIARYGHTAEADAALPLLFFAQELENIARAILEDAQFHKSRAQLRRRAVKLGAMTLALIDRIDQEGDSDA